MELAQTIRAESVESRREWTRRCKKRREQFRSIMMKSSRLVAVRGRGINARSSISAGSAEPFGSSRTSVIIGRRGIAACRHQLMLPQEQQQRVDREAPEHESSKDRERRERRRSRLVDELRATCDATTVLTRERGARY